MASNRLHVYTGEGKGKTTAAMGLALRMLGHGRPVMIVQFMKDGTSGEINALRSWPQVTVCTAPAMTKFTFAMTPQELKKTAEDHNDFAERLQPENAALVVLDELNCAIDLGLVSRETAQKLLDRMLQQAQTVVTGRGAPAWLMDRADYVSVINEKKHPFRTEQLEAREGIEW